jgi:long-chain acyl-CoA synthetase
MIIKGKHLEIEKKINLNEMFLKTVENYPDYRALTFYSGDKLDSLTYREFYDLAGRFSTFLKEMGVNKGDRVAIYSRTRYEWEIADYAVLMRGAMVVTVHDTLSKSQVEYIISDSGSEIVIVENEEMKKNLEGIDADIILLENMPDLVEKMDFDGEIVHPEPDDVASIVYTSGTTGLPKGAMLTHWNWVFNAISVMSVTPFYPGESYICYLPLSHVFQRIVFFAGVLKGANAVFITPSRFAQTLREIKPVAFVVVPRILERVNRGLIENVEEKGGIGKRIFYWAKNVAMESGRKMSKNEDFGLWLSLRRYIADRLVYSKVKNALGLQNIRFICSSGAELHKNLAYIFNGMGIPVIEGYGMTETSGPSNLNPLGRFKPGTVGPPIPGTEQKIAEDGEILIKGDNVMKGYWNKPDKTAEIIVDGWLYSGDLGEFDDDGYLVFSRRKKHIIVLDTGKNVSPITVEEELLKSDYIGDALVVGDGRPYIAALIQPNFALLLDFADDNGIPYDSSKVVKMKGVSGEMDVTEVGEDIVNNPAVIELYQQIVDRANRNLAHYEMIKRFRLLNRTFSIERGELTPTLKKRAHVIIQNYSKLIDEMYSK